MNSALICGICDIDCGSTTTPISCTDFRYLSFSDIDVFIITVDVFSS